MIDLSSIAPPPTILPSVFSERYCKLSAENSSATGDWKNLSYQVDMLDVLKNRPKSKICVFMTSAQIGKTACIKNILAYAMVYFSGGLTFLLPSESVARDYSKAQIGPMVRDTPILKAKIPMSKKNGNTHLYKSWDGGYLRMIGSIKSDRLSSFPSPVLICDELDRCSKISRSSSGVVEGNPIDLFLERFKNWHDRFALFTSTPTISGSSAIEDWWEKSDKRLPLVPCPHCSHMQFLDWERFSWVGKDEKGVEDDPDTIAYSCVNCSRSFDDSTRHKWLLGVKWVAQNPDSDVAGFHINAFYSPWSKWPSLCQKYISAGDSEIKRMVFWNTTLGIPYKIKAHDAPEWQELSNRDSFYKRYEIPEKVGVLLAACDVQGDRIECSVIGFHKKEAFVITHEEFIGNTSNIDDEVWGELDKFRKREWETLDGRTLKIHKMAIDAHYNTNQVAYFSKSKRDVVPVTGIDNWKQDILPSKPMDIKRNGRYYKSTKRRWPIGVSVVKMDLYARLKLEKDKESGVYPSEYIHFPDGMSDEYYKQLTGETCAIKADSRGKPKYNWIKSYGAVEVLDCTVYTLALYKIAGINRWKDSKWKK